MSTAKVLEKILKDKNFIGDSYIIDDLIRDYLDFKTEADLIPRTKKNYVGIEIECFSDIRQDEMKAALLEAGLLDNVQLTDDGSIDGEYDGDTMEFRVLAPENEIGSVLVRLSKAMKKAGRFGVNKSCGLHVHLDMRNRNFEKCYENLLKFQDIMFGMIGKDRWRNDMCAYSFGDDDRYTAINRGSYEKHETIEIRCHHATLDMKKIEKWVKLLICMVKSAPPKRVESKTDVLKWSKKFKGLSGYVNKHFNPEWFKARDGVKAFANNLRGGEDEW